ncbi:MAG: hypothetical protein QXU73_06320 [Thermoplasmata archaeon]
MADNRIKKWLMLQMWRLQQVAQVLTLTLMAANLSLMVWGYVKWRGSIFENSIAGPLVILLVLGLVIWSFAIVWDLRLKMWREQVSVLVEKNPYMKERLAPKEIALYALTWLPVLEQLGKDNPEMKTHAEALRLWLQKELRDDSLVRKDLEDILEYIGKDRNGRFGL